MVSACQQHITALGCGAQARACSMVAAATRPGSSTARALVPDRCRGARAITRAAPAAPMVRQPTANYCLEAASLSALSATIMHPQNHFLAVLSGTRQLAWR